MEGKEEDVRVGANKFPERQPIGTSAQSTDKGHTRKKKLTTLTFLEREEQKRERERNGRQRRRCTSGS
jgi:hypothetical protein